MTGLRIYIGVQLYYECVSQFFEYSLSTIVFKSPQLFQKCNSHLPNSRRQKSDKNQFHTDNQQFFSDQ